MCTLYGKIIVFIMLKLVVRILTTPPSEVSNRTARCGPNFSKFRGNVEDSDHTCTFCSQQITYTGMCFVWISAYTVIRLCPLTAVTD